MYIISLTIARVAVPVSANIVMTNDTGNMLYKNNRYSNNVTLYYFSINILAFYHECRPLIGYATRALFWDSE